MKKLTLFLVLLSALRTSAQYANLGTGTLKNELYWFDWAGFTIANNATRTFTTPDGLTITITFSNVSPSVPSPSVMNTWPGAVLHFLYDFSNTAIKPAFFSTSLTVSHQFTMQITTTRGGVPTPFLFVAADAEASSDKEVTTLSTSGQPWQTLEFFRNDPVITKNPVTGCGTNNISISDTYGNISAIGQNPVMMTGSPATGTLEVKVGMNRSTLGGMGVTFALFAPIDRGDLPASYGEVQHRLNYIHNNGCNYLAPLPSLSKLTDLTIGTAAGDADPVTSTDDNTNGIDEDGITVFPTYTGGGTYTVPVPVTNATGQTAYLTGWFDYNHDGQFSPNESTTQSVTSTSQVLLTRTGLPAILPRSSGQAFRFRLSTDAAATQKATGFAPDGEVEDYWVPCSFKINTSNDTAICAGRPVPITSSGGLNYTWNTATGLSDPSTGNPVATPAATTKYIVEGNNYDGCYAKDSLVITIKPGLVLLKSADTTICKAGTASLSVSGAGQYSWLPGVTLASPSGDKVTVSPTVPTKYYVTATAANGCTGLDSIRVAIHPPPHFAAQAASPVSCPGKTVLLTANGGDTYAWVYNNTVWAATASVSVQPAVDTIYKVAITENTCHQTDTLSIPVGVGQLPASTVTVSNAIDCSNDQARLQVTSNSADDTYAWDPALGITQLQSSTPTVTPVQPTRYYVTITNKDGCSKRDSVDVLVDFAHAKGSYAMANVFTPNGDGQNDCFGLKFWGGVKQLDFSVYNRWGGMVFHTNDPNACWDGRFQGREQSAATFIYQIRAVTVCGTVYRKGTVTLVR
jgi:gliding motility-associated-like protein